MNRKIIEEPEMVDTPEETTRIEPDDSWKNWRGYRRPHRVSTGGLLLILIGIIFLLSNFGLLSPDIWNILWKFWPIFLILFGLQILGGRSRIANIIVTIVGILVILIVFAFALAQVNPIFSHWLHTQLPFLNQLPTTY